MYRNKLLIIIALVVAMGATMSVTAQNATNSPYSKFGYGALDNTTFGIGSTMGGISYGVRSRSQINADNPASYTAMDSLTFMFDIGANLQSSWMSEQDSTEQDWNGNLSYLAMQFPLGKYMAASVGMQPFSSVGYEFATPLDNGALTSSGEGSINRAYLGVAGEMWGCLSLGVNASYMFGNLEYNDRVYPSSVTNYAYYWSKLSVRDFQYQLGMQYTQPINSREEITLGATFTPKQGLGGERVTIQRSVSSEGLTLSADTIAGATNQGYELPQTLGVGVSYTQKDRLLLGADVTYQEWSDILFEGERGELKNSLKLSLGGEFQPDVRDRRYYNRVKYRAGAFYNQSYLNIKDHDLYEWGVSCGVGLPIRGGKTYVNVGCEYVNLGAVGGGLIKDQKLRLTVSVMFNEMWFFQRKID